MADQRIIDLTAITTQSDTDLYECSLNGTGSRKETRAQMRANMQSHFNSVYLQIANNLADVANKTLSFNNIAPTTLKGDLIVFDGANNDRLAVGGDGLSLVADSSQPLGMRWAAGVDSPFNIIDWSSPAGPVQMITGNGYTTTNVLTFQVFTLPVAPIQGAIVIIHGYAAGGFQVNVGTSSMLRIGNQLVTANFQSRNQWDSITLRCVSAISGGQWKGEAVQSAGFIIN